MPGTLRVPALFIANRGQADPAVRFMIHTGDVRALFRPDGIAMEWRGARVRLSFPAANPNPEIEGLHREQAGANFLLGPTSECWRTSVPVFGAILYRELYPGIDMVYGGSDRRLKSDFIVAPGADPGVIRLRYEGLGGPRVDATGALVFGGPEAELREEAPEIFQEADGRRVRVRGEYRILEDGSVGFELGPYDRSLPLVIDPVLAFSTYLGGGGFDSVNAVATDSAGNAYVAGWTESADFPILNARQSRSGGRIDAFVAKFSPTGTLLYATYLGGSGEDRATGIAADVSGSVTVTGWTTSWDFPVLSPAQYGLRGGRDVFVARLNAAGNGLVYSTWLGGAGNDAGLAVALDSAGNAFVAGETMSYNLPVLYAFQPFLRGRQDALLAKLSSTGKLLFCTYLGGGGEERATAVAVDSFGNPHLTGSTDSFDFPVRNALQGKLGGGQDAFVMKMAANGAALHYSTYIGGTGGTPGYPESGAGIAVDLHSNAYVTGTTSSADFPTRSALRSSFAGGGLDAFVLKLKPDGTALVFSTYLGGSSLDYGNALALDPSGNVLVTGYTGSQDFPLTEPHQAANAGFYDAFLVAMTSDGALKFGTYLGGAGSDSGAGVAADSSGNVFVAGQALSANFPLASAFQPYNYGGFGGFLLRFRNSGGPPSIVSVTPSSGSGDSQIFTFVLSDPDGASDLAWVHVVVNSHLSFSGACYFAYNRAHNLLYLSADSSGSETLGTLPVGTPAIIDNSYCALNGGGATVTASGNTLSLSVPLTFRPASTGPKQLFVLAIDNRNLNSDWHHVGTWLVEARNYPPTAVSATPSSGAGASQAFSFLFADTNGAADLSWAHVILNSGPSSFCYFAYSPQAHLLYLADNTGARTHGQIPVGGATDVENDICRLHGATASATHSQNSLALTLTITFKSPSAGLMNIYLMAVDRSNASSGWVHRGTWNSRTSGAPPSPVSLSPASGSGLVQLLDFRLSDPDGGTDLDWLHVIINTTLSFEDSCYFAYNHSQNLLYLANDTATATAGAVTPGGDGIIGNSRCKLDGLGSTVAVSGITLTLRVPLVFTPEFAGEKTIYAVAVDKSGRDSGWSVCGSWTVAADE